MLSRITFHAYLGKASFELLITPHAYLGKASSSLLITPHDEQET